ncbi:hypothetical protein B0H21DRAFT_21425 [Amylocystis lapponica]|nr:hypothetical protein B0H21DRAFT_21425 [Amylocystis lapponica]
MRSAVLVLAGSDILTRGCKYCGAAIQRCHDQSVYPMDIYSVPDDLRHDQNCLLFSMHLRDTRCLVRLKLSSSLRSARRTLRSRRDCHVHDRGLHRSSARDYPLPPTRCPLNAIAHLRLALLPRLSCRQNRKQPNFIEFAGLPAGAVWAYRNTYVHF